MLVTALGHAAAVATAVVQRMRTMMRCGSLRYCETADSQSREIELRHYPAGTEEMTTTALA